MRVFQFGNLTSERTNILSTVEHINDTSGKKSFTLHIHLNITHTLTQKPIHARTFSPLSNARGGCFIKRTETSFHQSARSTNTQIRSNKNRIPTIPRTLPSSSDAPVLLLNQPNNAFIRPFSRGLHMTNTTQAHDKKGLVLAYGTLSI